MFYYHSIIQYSSWKEEEPTSTYASALSLILNPKLLCVCLSVYRPTHHKNRKIMSVGIITHHDHENLIMYYDKSTTVLERVLSVVGNQCIRSYRSGQLDNDKEARTFGI